MMRPKWSERGKGRSGKRRLGPWLHSVEAKCTLAFFLGCLMLFLMFSASSAPQRYSLTVGAISHQTITATKDVVDQITTEERRRAAANAVEPTYHLKEGATEQVMSSLTSLLDELRTVQQYGLTLRPEGMSDEELHNHTFEDTELE